MKSLFIAGLVFLFGSTLLIKYNCEKCTVGKYGYMVKMRKESLLKSCVDATVPYFVTYSYNGQMYNKQTRGDFCERHQVGGLMDIKMPEGFE